MTTKVNGNEIQVKLGWDSHVTNEDLESSKPPVMHRSIVQLQRCIEKQYETLPLPPKIKKVSLITIIAGGKGDVSAAVKVIELMQKMGPAILFDWLVSDPSIDLQPFLANVDRSKISIPDYSNRKSEDTVHADFLICGPVMMGSSTTYIKNTFNREIDGPRFDFVENCMPDKTGELVSSAYLILQYSPERWGSDPYTSLHKLFFPVQAGKKNDLIMGLEQGTGIFLEDSRVNAPLSRDYCCPIYLSELEDQGLKQDIFSAMGVTDGKSLRNYDTNSLNFGYAHKQSSWARFIDFVSIHEKEKNVIIVLNQVGEFSQCDTKKFHKDVFTPDRLELLKKHGYKTIVIKGSEKDPIVVSEEEGRQLTIILRPAFKPLDMRRLQLAAERLLGTGDNSAAENMAARCILYLYEPITEGAKTRFLDQQIGIANTISPDLAKLLDLFKTVDFTDVSVHKQIQEVERILQRPTLSQETMQFCKTITDNFSFKPILKAAILRTLWHNAIPELMKIEADALDNEFKTGLVDSLKNGVEYKSQTIQIKNLPVLAERVHAKVQEYLNLN